MFFSLRSLRAMLPCALVAFGLATTASPAAAADLPVCVPGLTACSAPASPVPSGGCQDGDLVPSPATAARVRAATLCLLNKERSKRGLRKLRAHRTLRVVAKRYARKMVKERFFDHTSPSGSTMIARIRSTSYLRGSIRRWSVGENLAWGSGPLATPAEIMKAWMNSAGHRANILDGGYREIGIGVAGGAPTGADSGATYVTEFGLRIR